MAVMTFDPPKSMVLGGGYRIAYREWGNPAAERALVLVHGMASSSLSWTRVAREFGDAFRIIATDNKGHGDSDRPDSGYRFRDQAAEVVELCGQLGISHAALMGHSWGGAISLFIASEVKPDFVDRLVLEEPGVGNGDGPSEGARARSAGNAASMGVSREKAEELARAQATDGWTEEDIQGKIDALTKGSSAAVRAVFEERDVWDLRPRLETVSQPSLLIRAEVSLGGVVDETAVAFAEKNPNMRVVTIPGANHNIHRGKFEEFMAVAKPFLLER